REQRAVDREVPRIKLIEVQAALKNLDPVIGVETGPQHGGRREAVLHRQVIVGVIPRLAGFRRLVRHAAVDAQARIYLWRSLAFDQSPGIFPAVFLRKRHAVRPVVLGRAAAAAQAPAKAGMAVAGLLSSRMISHKTEAPPRITVFALS